MANGTVDEKVARADRIREQSAKSAQRAEQHAKATRNAVEAIRNAHLPPYREEMDSEVTIEKLGVHARGIPKKALGFAIGVLALAAAVVSILRALG